MTSEEYQEHIVFQRLTSIEEVLSKDEVINKLSLDDLTFFQSAYEFINQKVKLTIPNLVQKAEMDSLSSELNSALNQFNSFTSSNNYNHINNITNNFNNAVSKSRNLPIITAHNDFNFSKEIASFEKNILDKNRLLEKERNALKSRIDDLNENVSVQETEITRLLKLIEDKEAEIKNLSSTFKTNFENIESKHEQQFENSQNTYRSEVDKLKSDFKKEVDELKNNLKHEANEILFKLITRLDEAKSLVGLIGNVGITGNYQNIANKHKKDADWWRWTAIIFMAFFSILLVYTIWDLSRNNFDWIKSLLRIIAAVALSYPATYAARESTRHRKLETINRNAELELASINPFIEDLNDEKKQLIKEKLVEKYFGNNKSNVFSEEKDNEKLSVRDVEKLLDKISKVVNK